MKRELTEKIVYMLQSHGIADSGISAELIILLNDYDVTKKETALALCNEEENLMMLRKFLIAKTVVGCTERTIGFYRVSIGKVLEGINKPIREITTDDIRYYMALREKRDGVSRVTINNEFRSFRSFFGWLRREELIYRDPTERIEQLKEPKKKKYAFTEMEVEKMRSACKNSKETAIIEILLSTGCRVTELVGIKLDDLQGDTVLVHGKGNKERNVYLNAKTQIAIEKYLSDRSDTNAYLFPKMKPVTEREKKGVCEGYYRIAGNIEPDGHMDKSSVECTVRAIGKRSGVKKAHPHRFRRTCATFALRRGMPIEQVSKMLGHEQLSTTQIYLDLNEEDLKNAHRRYVV